MSKKVDNQSEQNNKNVEVVIGNSSESKNINDKERLISRKFRACCSAKGGTYYANGTSGNSSLPTCVRR